MDIEKKGQGLGKYIYNTYVYVCVCVEMKNKILTKKLKIKDSQPNRKKNKVYEYTFPTRGNMDGQYAWEIESEKIQFFKKDAMSHVTDC